MTTFVDTISKDSYGVAFVDATGGVSSIQATASGQILQNVAPNAFDFSSNIFFGAQAGVIQQLCFNGPNLGGGSPLTINSLGGTTTNYTPAAVIFTCTFSPLQSTSKFYAVWNMNSGLPAGAVGGNAVAWCGYLNSAGSPVISSYQGNFNNGTGRLAASKAAALICSSVTTSQTLSVCAYRGTTASTPEGPYEYSAVTIYEVSTNPVSPFGILVTTAGSTLCLSFPLGLNSSLTIKGTWVAFNASTGTGGNGGDYLVVAVRGSSGNISIANSTSIINSLLGFDVAPYMYILANTATNSLQFYAVGIAGQSFNFQFRFTTN